MLNLNIPINVSAPEILKAHRMRVIKAIKPASVYSVKYKKTNIFPVNIGVK